MTILKEQLAAARPPSPAERALALLEPLSIATLFLWLLAKTWMRWPDPLIDFPLNLHVAWRLNEGDLLYEQIASWYGPLAHLAEATAFRVFGAGLDTLVWLNVGVTVAVLLLARAIVGALGSRLVVWACSVLFLSVFAFGHFFILGNYNFITPYVSQATYGLAGCMLVLWGLLRHLRTDRRAWMVLAGLGLGVAYLSKPEPLSAAVGTLAIYFLARGLFLARRQSARIGARWLASHAIWLSCGFLGIWFFVFIVFAEQGGAAYSLRATNWVPLSLLSYRGAVASSSTMLACLGFDQPWENLAVQLEAGGSLVLVCVALALCTWGRARAPRLGARWWGCTLAILAMAVIAGVLAEEKAGHWREIGRAIAFPVFAAALLAAARSFVCAWNGRTDFPRALALALVGTAAGLMLARMVLNVRVTHYGFFMAPLAVLFAVLILADEIPRRMEGGLRANWPMSAAVASLVLLAALQLGRASMDLYAHKTYPVGSGRDRTYTFEPHIHPSGLIVNTMIDTFRRRMPTARTVLALPQSYALNYYLRVPGPLPQREFHPLALTFAGLDQILSGLLDHPPEAVFLFQLDLREYGAPYFGADEASGRSILNWLRDNYTQSWGAGSSPWSATGHIVDLWVPRRELEQSADALSAPVDLRR